MIQNFEEEQEYNLIKKTIHYLEMYFEESRGTETDREWNDLEHEIIDVVNNLKTMIGEKDQ